MQDKTPERRVPENAGCNGCNNETAVAGGYDKKTTSAVKDLKHTEDSLFLCFVNGKEDERRICDFVTNYLESVNKLSHSENSQSYIGEHLLFELIIATLFYNQKELKEFPFSRVRDYILNVESYDDFRGLVAKVAVIHIRAEFTKWFNKFRIYDYGGVSDYVRENDLYQLKLKMLYTDIPTGAVESKGELT